METFPCVGGTSWSGPSSHGTAGKVCVVLAGVFGEGCAGSKLPVPTGRELVKLCLQWKVTGGEEKQLSNYGEVGLLSLKKEPDISGAQRCWLSQV